MVLLQNTIFISSVAELTFGGKKAKDNKVKVGKTNLQLFFTLRDSSVLELISVGTVIQKRVGSRATVVQW